MPPAFAGRAGSTGFAMYSGLTEALAGLVKTAVVHPSMKIVVFPWFAILKWNSGPPSPLSVPAVIRYGWNVVVVAYGLFRVETHASPGRDWTLAVLLHTVAGV